MSARKKLELTWIGKDDRPRLEPRILIEDPEKSYHAPHRVSKHDLFDNILIHGDNLLALKALEQEFTGKIKCIYIDPPYNTGAALEHYEDGLEHSLWLSMMLDRLELLRKLLQEDGSIWISIDDHEIDYPLVELPPMLLDYVEISQVLMNLIENAARYSPRGSSIEVAVEPHDA